MKFKSILALTLASVSMSTIAIAEPRPLQIYSGGEGGFYESTMANIAVKAQNKGSKYGLTYELYNSTGTVENVQALIDGDADLIIAQADGLVDKALPSGVKIYNAHQEAVYFLVNKEFYKKTGIYDLEDLEGEPIYIVMAEGSGAEVTMRNFVLEDSGYKDNLDKYTLFVEDNYEAAEIAAAGFYMKNGTKVTVAGMLTVSRIGRLSNSDIIEDFGKKLIVGEATDGDFNDAEDANGENLYTNCSIPSNKLQGLEGATYGDQDTICVRAQVVFNAEFAKQFGKNEKKVRRAISKAINRTL